MTAHPWQERLNSATHAFRIGMDNLGNENLVALIDCIGNELAGIAPQHLEEFQKMLAEILAAQTRKDYLFVADLLEFEVKTFLAEHAN